MTLHEVWFGKNPSLTHLIFFGCDAFVHVPKEKRNKLNNKVVKYIFIGYKDGMEGYEFWDPILKKTVYSRDVIFWEVGGTCRTEGAEMEKEPTKLVFEMKNEEHDSDKSTKSNEVVETPTLIVRRSEQVRKIVERYSALDFYSTSILFSNDDEPGLVR